MKIQNFLIYLLFLSHKTNRKGKKTFLYLLILNAKCILTTYCILYLCFQIRFKVFLNKLLKIDAVLYTPCKYMSLHCINIYIHVNMLVGVYNNVFLNIGKCWYHEKIKLILFH